MRPSLMSDIYSSSEDLSEENYEQYLFCPIGGRPWDVSSSDTSLKNGEDLIVDSDS